MEILNILYNNNLIAVYLIGAILVIVLIFIIISSISTTPKETKNKILEDPTDKDNDLGNNELIDIKDNKINDMVDNLYQQSIKNDDVIKSEENSDINSVLQEFEVPKSVIEEVVKPDYSENVLEKTEETPHPEVVPINEENLDNMETPKLKEEVNNTENIDNMLKRLYDLRQDEKDGRKNALINEIIDLKKQIDEALKSRDCNYELDNYNVNNKELADYYLFNKDIEFPKLK